MRFAEPWMLLGAPLALLLVPLLALIAGRARRRRLLRFAEAPALARIASQPSPAVRIIRVTLATLAVVALAVAAARPQWGSSPDRVRRRGLDVAFVLDTSVSMTAPVAAGARESRLDAAHRAIVDLAEMLHGDRIALIAFAGDAQVLCPLTVDDGALQLFLESARPDLLPVPGSDIGRGIAQAMQAFPGRERKFKVIVLLSDGEDHEGQAISAATEAKERGVVVHALGFGSPEGEPIPLHDDSGRPAGFKKDAEGHVVSTRLDERTLRAIAAAGGGSYVPWRSGDRGLRSIADAVAAMEKRELETTVAATLEDHCEIPLLIAFTLLALEALLARVMSPARAPVLRREAVVAAGSQGAATGRLRRGRRRRRKPAATAAALMLALAHAEARSSTAATASDDGEKAFEEKRFDAAAAAFRRALEKEPGSAELHYNLGTALLHAGKVEDAIQELSRAAATGSSDVRARAQYNIGNAYHALERRKEALEAYRGALRLSPSDLEAKHNYELAKAELERTPPPTPTPSPSPSPDPDPSPSPSPSPQAEPSPGDGEPSPSAGASPSPSGSEGAEPSPTPGEAEGEPSPTPSGEMSKDQAERLLDALAAQERADLPSKRRPAGERTPAKDW